MSAEGSADDNSAHEMRSLLHIIIGFADLIARGKAGPLTPQQAKLIEEIGTSARRLHVVLRPHLDHDEVAP